MTKFVVVTGGVVSGLGKGISISSIGVLLKASGLTVTSIKIDPYLNSDAGTMSPFEHGEVFVLNDGGEADLDLGNYERFLGVTLSRDHNVTTGKVYSQVINAERRGAYLGKTVQVIPHVTDAIQQWIERVARMPVDGDGKGAGSATGPAAGAAAPPPDVCLIEVGGTVGDIESLVFLEALRQFQFKVGPENICFVHVSLVPVLGAVGEQKTKPTQHTVKELRSVGIHPDVILCRSAAPLEHSTRDKLALFCQVPPGAVLTVHDVPNIYHVPLLLQEQRAADIIAARLRLALPHPPALGPWQALAAAVDAAREEVRIALVGKYTGLQDSYLSVIKSLQHAAIAVGRRLVVDWVDAAALEEGTAASDPDTHASSWETVRSAHGILVPGGFGDRGVEGKIAAVRFARESRVPFLGICLGFQCAVIEYARSVCGLAGAHSTEMDPATPHPAVVFMPEIDPHTMGGTMRLGARPTLLRRRADGAPTLASDLYGRGTSLVWERHRHRYEVNPELVPSLQAAGLFFAGTDEKGQRMEIAELDRSVHPFFFGCQYHPEFQSFPHAPSPPFHGLLLAASGQLSALPLPARGAAPEAAKAELAPLAAAPAAAGGGGAPAGEPAPGGILPGPFTSFSSGCGEGAAPAGVRISAGRCDSVGSASSPPSPSRPVRTLSDPVMPPVQPLGGIAPPEAAGDLLPPPGVARSASAASH